MSTRIYFTLLLISGILFLILFSTLSFHNRLAADDFYYSGCVPEAGIWNCMKDLYFNYSGRWTAYLLTGFIVYLYYKLPVVLFIFNIITIFILIFLLYNILRVILEKISKSVLPRNLIFVFTLILTSGLFFNSFNQGETWFWLVQVCTYLWSIIAFCLTIKIIIKENFKWSHFPLLLLSAIFIGGASESYALIFIFLLISIFILISTSNEIFKLIIKNKRAAIYKLLLSVTIITASFIITMMAPGNEVRLNALPQTPFIERLIIPSESFIGLMIFNIIPIVPGLFIFCLPWLILGNYFSTNKKAKLGISIIPFLYLFLILFIFILPTSLIMSELGPDRALSIISFCLVFFFAGLFYYIGFNFNIKSKYLEIVKLVSAPLIFLVTLFNIINQYQITSEYTKAYDERMEFLHRTNDPENNLIEVPTLPPSGMLYSAEISEDPDHFTNRFLASALSLHYKVKRTDAP